MGTAQKSGTNFLRRLKRSATAPDGSESETLKAPPQRKRPLERVKALLIQPRKRGGAHDWNSPRPLRREKTIQRRTDNEMLVLARESLQPTTPGRVTIRKRVTVLRDRRDPTIVEGLPRESNRDRSTRIPVTRRDKSGIKKINSVRIVSSRSKSSAESREEVSVIIRDPRYVMRDP